MEEGVALAVGSFFRWIWGRLGFDRVRMLMNYAEVLVIDDCSVTVFVLHRALAGAVMVRATCSSRAGIEIFSGNTLIW